MKSNLTGIFYGKLLVEYINGNVWRLKQDPENKFGMTVGGIGDIDPDDGFIFDFASVPPPARWVYPKTGDGKGENYGQAAAIHDWIYSYPVGISRKMADRIFLLGMEIQGVRPTLRNLFYASVRAFGGLYYGKPNKLNELRNK